jgi:hypothetical protein
MARSRMTPRATRFPLRLRAKYRCAPSRRWHPAITVNVSRTGLLLRAHERIDVGRPIDIAFRLSQNLLDTLSSAVICRCRVVRIEPTPDDDAELLIATEIVTYAFARQRPSGELPECF